MTGIIIKFAIIIVLIVLSAFFSSSETALTVLSPMRVRSLVEAGARHAEILERVVSRKDKMLSTVLVCNNVVNLAASALMTVAVQELFGNSIVSVGTGVLTILILIFGEVAPKTKATIRAEKLALRYCGIINALMTVLTPIVAAINFLATGVLRISGVKKGEEAEKITEEELKTIVEVSHEEGIIENEEKEIINNIFEFSDTVVHEIMVPRINIVSIDIDSKYTDVMRIFKENLYTRLPVFDGAQIVGIINVKDLMFMSPSQFTVTGVMRDAAYTFEQKKVAELFMEMKKNHCAMEVVLDEYGDTAGIVTLEDIIEEIVGDIRDEYDEDEADEIIRTGNGCYEIKGHVSIDDVNDALGTSLESENYDSIGGLLIEALGRLPEQGDCTVIDNISLKASRVDGTKIQQVRLQIK